MAMLDDTPPVSALEVDAFDAILVAASGPCVPEVLRAQLAPGGRLVMPVDDGWLQRLVCVTREALLSGLVSRVANEGYLVEERDVVSLLNAGLSAGAVREAFERGAGTAFEHARGVVERVVPAPMA